MPRSQLLAYTVVVCLIFKGTSKVFSRMAIPSYVPTSKVWVIQFIHILSCIPSSLAIREIHIKTIMQYHYTLRMAKMKNSSNTIQVPIWDMTANWWYLDAWEEMRVTTERTEGEKELRKARQFRDMQEGARQQIWEVDRQKNPKAGDAKGAGRIAF